MMVKMAAADVVVVVVWNSLRETVGIIPVMPSSIIIISIVAGVSWGKCLQESKHEVEKSSGETSGGREGRGIQMRGEKEERMREDGDSSGGQSRGLEGENGVLSKAAV